jgi:hypothetical protein
MEAELEPLPIEMIDTNRYVLNHRFQRIHFETFFFFAGGGLIAASLLGGTASEVTTTEESTLFSSRVVTSAGPA